VFGAGAEAPPATFEPDEELAEAEEAAAAAPAAAPSTGPSAAQLTAIKAAIANATTLAEVQRLENALKTGLVPSDVQVEANGDHSSVMEEG